MESILLKTIKGEKTSRPPVWFMRQAGRILPNYMKLKESFSFHELMNDKELASKVTLLPISDLSVDAAILFSDILVIPHDREPLINVKITENSKTVKVIVSDNGLGVSKINRDKIFEPKFTTKSDGMGLGLGIVRSIINSHRGKISYKSKSKKGTDFKISLPK